MHSRFSKFLQLVVMLFACAAPTKVWAQQGVGIDVPSPDPSAILDLDDAGNKRGLLVPRMSSTERENIPSPADGLLVYDTDQKMFYHYDGGAGKWQAVNPFSYQKGASAVAEDNFIIELTNDKSVVIGTVSAPSEKLEVGGNIRATGTISSDALSSNSLNTGSLTSESSTTNTLEASSGTITTLTSTTVNSTTTNTTDVVASGTVTANTFVGYGTIPVGGIIMWSGTTIPDGWQLCDGSNGTPDLRGRFVVGIGQASGQPTNYALGQTGGSETNDHTHTVGPIDGKTESKTGNRTGGKDGNKHLTDSHNHPFHIDQFNSGGASNTENRPPFYALAYIIRIK